MSLFTGVFTSQVVQDFFHQLYSESLWANFIPRESPQMVVKRITESHKKMPGKFRFTKYSLYQMDLRIVSLNELKPSPNLWVSRKKSTDLVEKSG